MRNTLFCNTDRSIIGTGRFDHQSEFQNRLNRVIFFEHIEKLHIFNIFNGMLGDKRSDSVPCIKHSEILKNFQCLAHNIPADAKRVCQFDFTGKF